MPKLGEALLEAFSAHGAREIFGIPGDFVLALLQGDRGERRPPAYNEPRAGGGLRR